MMYIICYVKSNLYLIFLCLFNNNSCYGVFQLSIQKIVYFSVILIQFSIVINWYVFLRFLNKFPRIRFNYYIWVSIVLIISSNFPSYFSYILTIRKIIIYYFILCIKICTHILRFQYYFTYKLCRFLQNYVSIGVWNVPKFPPSVIDDLPSQRTFNSELIIINTFYSVFLWQQHWSNICLHKTAGILLCAQRWKVK